MKNMLSKGWMCFLLISFFGPVTSAWAIISGVTASVSPSTVNMPAKYTLTFTTGGSGALTMSNTIIAAFPQNTTVSTSFPGWPVAQIWVNGNTASASGAGQTLTINVPAYIGINTSVTIIIFAGTNNIVNPSLPGTTYQIGMHTSIETTVVNSGNYTVTPSLTALNVGTVAVIPNTIGNSSTCTISVTLSANGALWGDNSQIVITFPADTLVQNNVITGVTVDVVGAFSAIGNQGARTITIVPDQDLVNSASFNVVIPTVAHRNPTSTGNYTLTAYTTAQTTAGTSLPYAIGPSSTPVNVTGVTPNPATLGNNSQYTIDFNTSADGALLNGTSQIIITFPADTAVTNGPLGSITVQGMLASATGNAGARTVTITVPLNIAGSTSVSIYIPPAYLRNPTTAASYTLDVATSVQPVGISPTYPIGQSGTSVVITSVVPSPNYISQSAVYTIDFNTSGDGALIGGTSQIMISFQANTSITNGALSGVTVNGIAVTTATGNSASLLITLDLAQNISGNTTGITISLPNTAVRNPSTPGSYTLTVATSVQPAGLSPSFDISLVPTPTITPTITPTVQLLPDNTAFTYPSPAKGDTLWFYYSVQGPAEVLIEIYNVIGEKGKVITNSHTSSGNQRTSWDIKDVATGLYFYRLYIDDAAGKRDLGLKKFYIIK